LSQGSLSKVAATTQPVYKIPPNKSMKFFEIF
jgi:hypothetical protein